MSKEKEEVNEMGCDRIEVWRLWQGFRHGSNSGKVEEKQVDCATNFWLILGTEEMRRRKMEVPFGLEWVGEKAPKQKQDYKEKKKVESMAELKRKLKETTRPVTMAFAEYSFL